MIKQYKLKHEYLVPIIKANLKFKQEIYMQVFHGDLINAIIFVFSILIIKIN